jgi:hypothetical protein
MSGYDDNAAVAAALLLVAVFWFFFAVIFYVISAIFYMKIFEKAGVEGKWRAWVPVYNGMIFIKLGDLNPWWFLILVGAGSVLSFVPFLGSLCFLAAGVYSMLAAWRVGLKLQKEAVWLILYFFLSLVWLGINAFDKSRWNTAIPAAPWAGNFLADKTVWAGIPVQTPAGGYPANPVTQPGGYPQQPAPGAYPPPPAPGAYPPPPAATTPPPPAGPATPPAAPTPPPTTQPPAGPTEPPAPPAPPTNEPPAPPSDPDAPRV